MNTIEQVKKIKSEVVVEQIPAEFAELIDLAREHNVGSVLEIGSRFGGTLKCWLDLLEVDFALAVDLPLEGMDPTLMEKRRNLWESWAKPSQDVRVVFGKSESVDTLLAVSNHLVNAGLQQVDMVFIDGGHTYEQARTDFDHYQGFAKKLIAFHDITPSTVLAPRDFGVDRVWSELKQGKDYKEFAFPQDDRGGYGIGVICKTSSSSPQKT